MEAKTIRVKRCGGLLCAAIALIFSGSTAAQEYALIPVRTNTTATITAQRDGTPTGNTITAAANAVDTLRIPMPPTSSIRQSGLRAQNKPAITHTHGAVTLNLPGNPAYQTLVSVYSLDGRRIMNATVGTINGASGISRQSLAAGAYLIRVGGADRSQTNTFRVSHRGGNFNINVAFTGNEGNLNLRRSANADGGITITVEPRAGAVAAGFQSRTVQFTPAVGVNPLQIIDLTITSTPDLGDPAARMEAVRQALTNDVPSSATRANTYGTNRTITYQSRRFGGTQTAIVVLPPNHDDGRLFPILYFGHGITGSAMVNNMSSRTILGNLVASGEAKEMILVQVNLWTPVTQAQVDLGNVFEATAAYANFIDDWADNLHPHMLENFPVAPGRENVAITGFSMGGNMAIRTWMAHPDKIGFVGLGDPPAISTTANNIRDSRAGAANAPRPWLILVTGAESEGNIVGNGPQSISNALTQRGFDNVWHFVPGSGHNQTVMTPHLYNFLRAIF